MIIAGLTHKPGKPGLRAQEFWGAHDLWRIFFFKSQEPWGPFGGVREKGKNRVGISGVLAFYKKRFLVGPGPILAPPQKNTFWRPPPK